MREPHEYTSTDRFVESYLPWMVLTFIILLVVALLASMSALLPH